YRTDASSLMNLFRNIGSSLGVAVLTAILASNIQLSHSDLGANITASTIGFFDLSALDRYQNMGGAAAAIADAEINRQAALIAYIDNFWVMMWMAFLTCPLVLLIKKPPPQLVGRQ